MAKDKNDKSPMMMHYLSLKDKYPDAVILYRLGDFYEMFDDDAEKCSRILGLTLTARNNGTDTKSKMCGIPQKALDVYIAKLIDAGEKVAVCEQLTEPEKGTIVQRDVVRVITPGTVVDSDILDDKSNVYIASIFVSKNDVGISYSDISTGEFVTTEFLGCDNLSQTINDYLAMFMPKEVICNKEALSLQYEMPAVKAQLIPDFTYYDISIPSEKSEIFKEISNQFGFQKIKDCECYNNDFALKSTYFLLKYITQTQKRHLTHIHQLKYLNTNSFMQLDSNSRLNLELVSSIKDRKKRNSLYWLLDKTKTCMGSRTLRSYIEKPLFNDKMINYRLNAVGELFKNIITRENIRDLLSSVYDLERLCGRISYGSLTPKDCVSLRESLKNLSNIKNELSKFSSKMLCDINSDIYNFDNIYDMLIRSINQETATNNLKDNGFILKGFNAELDSYLNISSSSTSTITELEVKERNETKIKNLHISYNKVFGYFIEVPKSQAENVPYNYIRKQTLANSERYVTIELKELEDKILNANDRIVNLEKSIFKDIKEVLFNNLSELQSTAKALCNLDAICSLATVASEKNYCKPIINSNVDRIEIIDGRHPIVEVLNKNEDFVPNDTILNNTDCKTMIITGPNMAGKSTYMRQVALIIIMAHIGSFVPATSAKICLTDRIFTRIGANDDLAFGQSTFMVEMNEVSNILSHATNKSFVILDEVGRGTSTFDGLSIAWSVLEYINNNLNVKTLFATHFHELTELESKLDGIKNYRVSVKEYNNSVIFLRKIVRGSANRSFGIEVASLANLPEEVISRAKEILSILESNDLVTEKQIECNEDNQNATNAKNLKRYNQLYEILSDINVNNLTPLNAFDTIIELTKIIGKN